MKTQTKPKSKFRGFYTALALSLVMIGAACVFAYRQTSQTLEQNLNSLSEQMEVTTTATLPYEAPVVGVQTDVAMETETTVTATSATEETAAPETTPVLEWLKRHAWKACNRQNRFGGPCTS